MKSGLSKFEIMVAIYIFCLFASETMGFKLIELGRINELVLNVSVAIFLLPVMVSINDIVAEVYGYKKALAMSKLGLMIIVGIGSLSLIFTSLEPAERFLASNEAYMSVFGFSARASMGSLIAFAMAQGADILIFRRLREIWRGKKWFWLGSNLSNLVSLLIDTIVFMVIVRWNLDRGVADNMIYLTGLVLPYWIAKYAVAALMTPVTVMGVKWMKRERVDEKKEIS